MQRVIWRALTQRIVRRPGDESSFPPRCSTRDASTYHPPSPRSDLASHSSSEDVSLGEQGFPGFDHDERGFGASVSVLEIEVMLSPVSIFTGS